jgi:hypothetical protein
VYQLWTGDSYCLPLRIKTYFPNLAPFSGSSPGLFYFCLSESEKNELHDTALKCCDFLKRANEWEAKRNSDLQKTGYPSSSLHICITFLSDIACFRLPVSEENQSSYQRDFDAAFRNKVDINSLIDHIQFYLKRVQSIFSTLQDIFPDSNSISELPEI